MDTLKFKGTYKFEIRDINGKIRDSWTVDNAIMTAGKGELTNLIGNVSSPVYFTYIAVGTSNTAVSVGQTALAAEITDTGLARHIAVATRTTTTTTNDTLTLIYTWTATGSKTIEEAGVFNASSGGIMLSRALTNSVIMASTETLTITYTLALS